MPASRLVLLRCLQDPVQLLDPNDDARADCGALHYSSNRALRKTKIPGRFNLPAIAQNEIDLSQQIVTRDRSIVLEHCISASPHLLNAAATFRQDAMNDESALAPKQGDFASKNFSTIKPADDERISRPDCRQHAPTANPQPQSS
jgi:hypothetical protein